MSKELPPYFQNALSVVVAMNPEELKKFVQEGTDTGLYEDNPSGLPS
jgi:hypothetical protein